MPTITRFLTLLLTLGAICLAAVLALAYLVSPHTRTFVVPVDPSVLTSARPLSPPPAAPIATGAVDAGTETSAPAP
jgi:hypothetical protein